MRLQTFLLASFICAVAFCLPIATAQQPSSLNLRKGPTGAEPGVPAVNVTVDRRRVEMRVKELPVKKIEFLVKLLFNLKGFVLKVQNGAIQELQTGACEIKGTVSYAGQVIVEKKLSPINLPGRIDVPALIGSLQTEPTEITRAV